MALNQSGLFFVPKGWQTAGFVRWLKRIHAWSGFWGAFFFLLMGTSGFMLNHRAQLKIDTGEPVEVSTVQLPVTPGAIKDAEGLGVWAKQQLKLPVKAQAPRGGPGGPGGPGGEGRGREGRPGGGRGPESGGGEGSPLPTAPAASPAGEARFMGREVKAAESWTRSFNMPNARVTVEYVPGANHVTAKREEQGVLGTLKNMHKGVGLPIAWVLLIDTIAGALITMSITGYLLWSRMHGSRLLAGALVGGSFLWAFFSLSTMG